MRNLVNSALAVLSLALASCQTTCCDNASPQAVVDATAAANPGCKRLTLHCVQADGSAKVCASTDTKRVGTASDPEDVSAMASGEAIILEVGGAIDVTVPILQTDGKWTTVCGVTMERNDMDRDQVIASAKTIAMAVKNALGDCCANGSCCSK
jgi:intracellular sulfur oxidation DsrE/DsrF family protein